jgi:hypothetical protein
MFWHNEDHKPKGYHKNKFIKCFSKNINLIYIWEDRWKNDNNIKDYILTILNKTNDLYNLYKYIKDNNLILILNSYSNILQYDFELLNVTEKRFYFKKGDFNFYNIDKIYLKPI